MRPTQPDEDPQKQLKAELEMIVARLRRDKDYVTIESDDYDESQRIEFRIEHIYGPRLRELEGGRTI